MTAPLAEVFERLNQRYGPQHWWPAETPLEMIVGAVLTQNTAWKNVVRAIDNLRAAELLDARRLYELGHDELAELIRPAGYFNLKARRLKNLLAVVCEEFGGSLERLFALGLPELRERLLAVSGVGPETADSIVLYGAGLPRFVVDAYTHRVLVRHGWIEPEADYHALQEFFESRLADDVDQWGQWHALLVRLGNEHCRKQARCDGCPLADLLPESGPVDPAAS